MTHREMRNNSAEILRAVAAGETVQVTNHGRVAAVISPPDGRPLGQLVAAGQARPRRRPVSDLAGLARRSSDVSSADLLADVRGAW